MEKIHDSDHHETTFSNDRILKLERKKRAFLIYALSLIGTAVCLLFGIQNLSEGMSTIGVTVIVVAILACTNLAYFFYSGRANFAATIFGVMLVVLGGFLLASGGYHNTGLLWIYPMLAMTIFTNNFRIGLIYSCSFIIFCSLLLFIPDNPLIFADYTLTVRVRFLVTLIVLLLLCLTVEYSHGQLRTQVRTLHNQLVLAANTDSLTQLPNRRCIIDNYFANDVINGQSDKQTILLCDVDHFKDINDSLGHDAGDKALQVLAQRFRKAIRNSDVIARWGGEEFLILLPNTSYDISLQRAEKIRKAISGTPFKLAGRDYSITVSIGVASTNGNQSTSAILKKADEKLYLAKTQGRNCVC